ncbi:MAG: NUDIX hydrolase [Nitrospinales bacterium]
MVNTEWFDIVDSDDVVIGRAPRSEVHAKGLLHRAVHIMVFNSSGELFIQKRVMTKDENPGLLDTSSAGHVSSGEDYLSAAHRELEEELGVKPSLDFFAKISASVETAWEHLQIYLCKTDEQIIIDASEISEGRYWSLDEIRMALIERPEDFTSSFKAIWELFILKNGQDISN